VRLQEEKKQEQPNYTDYIYSHLFNHHPPGDVWQAVVVVLCLEEEEARMIRTCAMASKKNPAAEAVVVVLVVYVCDSIFPVGWLA
jgi:hypothetical protein